MPPVIDMWLPVPPLPDVMDWNAEHFPKPTLSYMRVFGRGDATMDVLKAWAGVFRYEPEAVVETLDEAGIDRALITGFDEKSTCGDVFVPNELIAPLAERYPERFIPYAGVDIMRGAKAVRELERWVGRGFKGLSLRPFMINLPPDDPAYYPFYAKCVEMDIPVSIHTSANWTSDRINDLGHPRHIDPVAAHFPDLKLIMSHGGYPWVLEAVLLAWKYPNVYLELAAHRPKHMSKPGTGWEPLLQFGQTTIQDKVLFGSGWFLLGRPLSQIAEEFRALPIKPEVLAKWMGGNAERLHPAG
jgi:predicted TIM-barrel fold metal-dependent hydrolase